MTATTTVTGHRAPSTATALNVLLWLAQAALAIAFASAGFLKLVTPIDELTRNMAWVADVPVPLVRFIAVCELAGSVGIVLPALTRIRPVLTPLAGACLALLMLLAAGFHISRGEASVIGLHAVLFGLAAFVAWGRYRKMPIAPRRTAG